jgi:HK97 family phage prohead protease
MQRETKQIGLTELKFSSDGQTGTFTGYGAYFNNTDSYGDVIAPGAFARTLREAKRNDRYPAMLLQHGSWLGGDDNMPVGVWTSMKEDDNGLLVEGKLADTTRGKDAYALLKMEPRPAITGLSIGFFAKEVEFNDKPKGPRRTIKDVDLLEVSLVTFPANDKARITGVKSLNARDLEAALRSRLNLSKSDAVTAIGLMKEHLRDGGVDDQDDRDGADLEQLAELLRRNTAMIRGSHV